MENEISHYEYKFIHKNDRYVDTYISELFNDGYYLHLDTSIGLVLMRVTTSTNTMRLREEINDLKMDITRRDEQIRLLQNLTHEKKRKFIFF